MRIWSSHFQTPSIANNYCFSQLLGVSSSCSSVGASRIYRGTPGPCPCWASWMCLLEVSLGCFMLPSEWLVSSVLPVFSLPFYESTFTEELAWTFWNSLLLGSMAIRLQHLSPHLISIVDFGMCKTPEASCLLENDLPQTGKWSLFKGVWVIVLHC